MNIVITGTANSFIAWCPLCRDSKVEQDLIELLEVVIKHRDEDHTETKRKVNITMELNHVRQILEASRGTR